MPYINTHPDDETLRALMGGTLSPEVRGDLAAHLASCAPCMERFIALQEAAPAPAPPRGLQERILLQLQHLEKQKRDFRLYCLRLATAAAASVALTFGVFTPEAFRLYAQEAPPPPPAAVHTAPRPEPEIIPLPAPSPSALRRKAASIRPAGDPRPAPLLSKRPNGEL